MKAYWETAEEVASERILITFFDFDMRWQERKQGTSQSGIMTGHPLFLTMKRIAILKTTCNKLLMFLTRIERVSDGPEPSGLSIILQEQMGMTGCRKTMLRIVAYHGLKARCIAVLLHTRMSHTGLEPVSGD